MIQTYLISILYLVMSSLLLLLDYNRDKLVFMLKIRARLENDKKSLNVFFFLGIITSLLMLFFPIPPGPVILGDLIPSLAVFISAVYFRVLYSDKYKDNARFYDTWLGKFRKYLAYSLLLTTVLHFILPFFVLI